MTDQEFLDKAKEKYGYRGLKDAREHLEYIQRGYDGVPETDENTRVKMREALIYGFFINKDKAREKFTPKKYRKEPSCLTSSSTTPN